MAISDESVCVLSGQRKARPRYKPVLYCDECCLGRFPESSLAMQDSYDLWQAKKSANLSKVRKIRFAANT